jgi:hypothetical protein
LAVKSCKIYAGVKNSLKTAHLLYVILEKGKHKYKYGPVIWIGLYAFGNVKGCLEGVLLLYVYICEY